MDVIVFYQVGIYYVVVFFGMVFIEDQIFRFWKFVLELVICFDGDVVGVLVVYRVIDWIFLVLKSGYFFQFSFLFDGMDLDDLVKQQG